MKLLVVSDSHGYDKELEFVLKNPVFRSYHYIF